MASVSMRLKTISHRLAVCSEIESSPHCERVRVNLSWLVNASNVASSNEKNGKAATPAGGLQAPVIGLNFRVQQAKIFAIAQTQEDGCTGNYRIFDSPFGNFLVPVIPTRADLAL